MELFIKRPKCWHEFIENPKDYIKEFAFPVDIQRNEAGGFPYLYFGIQNLSINFFDGTVSTVYELIDIVCDLPKYRLKSLTIEKSIFTSNFIMIHKICTPKTRTLTFNF